MVRRNGIYHWIYKERCNNEKISDPSEQETRDDLLDKILEAANEYESHLFEHRKLMKLEAMIERGIVIEECKHSSNELKKQWTKAFASELTKEIKARIHFKDFLWHAFSYEVLKTLKKGDARRAFNRKKKKSVYVFYQHREITYFINDASRLKSADFDLEDDVYIFDADMNWTYVRTHESECGPYYFSKE